MKILSLILKHILTAIFNMYVYSVIPYQFSKKKIDEKQKLVLRQILQYRLSIFQCTYLVLVYLARIRLVHDDRRNETFRRKEIFFLSCSLYTFIICTRHTHTKQNCARSLGSLTVGSAFFPLFPINPKSIDFDSRFRDREFRFCKWSTVEQNRSAGDLFLVDDPSLSPLGTRNATIVYRGDIDGKNTVTVRKRPV